MEVRHILESDSSEEAYGTNSAEDPEKFHRVKIGVGIEGDAVWLNAEEEAGRSGRS
jgi:hypothetical protein